MTTHSASNGPYAIIGQRNRVLQPFAGDRHQVPRRRFSSTTEHQKPTPSLLPRAADKQRRVHPPLPTNPLGKGRQREADPGGPHTAGRMPVLHERPQQVRITCSLAIRYAAVVLLTP